MMWRAMRWETGKRCSDMRVLGLCPTTKVAEPTEDILTMQRTKMNKQRDARAQQCQ